MAAIARREALRVLPPATARGPADPVDPGYEPLVISRLDVARAVRALPAADRRLYWPATGPTAPQEQAAALAGVSPANAKVRLHRARARLREALG